MSRAVNYAKMDNDRRRHHERYVRRISAMPRKLMCQDCGGAGGEVEPVLDYGEGPWFDCGWCEGTGHVLPHRRGEWLKYKRDLKRFGRVKGDV